MNYIELYNSDYVKETYNKIEELKKDYPVNHGFIHINNALNNAKIISKILEFSDKETDLLLIAVVLHDIGYLLGREEHAKNGAILALSYLTNNTNLEQKDIIRISKAISSHAGLQKDDYKDNISIGLILADKMDFSKSRYDRYLCSFMEKYKIFLSIDNIKLEKIDNIPTVVIYSKDIDIESKLNDRNIYVRLKEVLKNINEYTNYKIDLKISSKEEILNITI